MTRSRRATRARTISSIVIESRVPTDCTCELLASYDLDRVTEIRPSARLVVIRDGLIDRTNTEPVCCLLFARKVNAPRTSPILLRFQHRRPGIALSSCHRTTA